MTSQSAMEIADGTGKRAVIGGVAIRRTEGYTFTILSGEVTFQDGVPTEAMPGKLIRRPLGGPRPQA